MNDPNIPGTPNFPSENDTRENVFSRLDETFVEAPEEASDSEAIPDGKYQVNVEKVELTTTKSSGQHILKWSLRILGPQFQGRMLWRNNMIVTHENVRWLKRDLVTSGLKLARLSDLPNHLDDLLDVQLEVTKRTKGEHINVHFNRRIADPGLGAGRDGRGDDLPF